MFNFEIKDVVYAHRMEIFAIFAFFLFFLFFFVCHSTLMDIILTTVYGTFS